MNKETQIDVWAVQLIHEHGGITHRLSQLNMSEGDAREILADRIEQLEERLFTIEEILANHHNVDLLRELKL